MDGNTEGGTSVFIKKLMESIVEVLGKETQDDAPDGIPLDRVLHLIQPDPDEGRRWDLNPHSYGPRANLHKDWRWDRLSSKGRQSVLDRVLQQLVEEGTLESKQVDLGLGVPEPCYSLKA